MLSDEEQRERRERFRVHWQEGVAFNKASNITVLRWDPDGVELHLPYRDDLSAHPGVFHGGMLSALVDTAGCGAVAAGHDYNKGSRITTVALAVQYYTVAAGEDAVAFAHCTRRGRNVHFAEVVVRSRPTEKVLAQGLVTVSVSGTRQEVVGPEPSAVEIDDGAA